jgi:PAS domain S-box-containing protein
MDPTNDNTKVESPTVLPGDSLVPLESVVCTEKLNRRPSRAPDYQAENCALVALAQALADSPRTILQRLAQMILEVFRADSAGISLLTEDEKSFYWPAIAGMWQPHIGGGTPRDFGPCGDVLDRDAPMLFTHWERRYPYLLSAMPLAEEGLLVPFCVQGRAVGTIWAIAHDDRRKFDAEDMRQLVSLGSFASSAYQVVAFLDALEQRDEALRQSCEELEQRVVERTSQLTVVNEDLRKEILERKRVEEERERLLARVQAAHGEAEAAQHRFRDLVNSIEGIVWEADAVTFKFSFVSKQAERVLGYPVERWLSEPTFWRDHLHPDDREGVVAFCVKATAEKRDHNFEYRMIAADGRIVWLRDLLTVVVEDNRATSLRSVMFDITERRLADEELRESEKRYRYIFETAGVSIWEEDFSQVRAAIDNLKAQGVRNFRWYLAAHPEFIQQAVSMVKVIDVNDATVRLFEAQSKDELLVSLDKIFLLRTLEVFAGELVAIAEGRTSFESETILQTLKGGKLTVLFTITFPPQPAKLDSVLVSIMDITERKRADEALHKTQAELAHVTRVATLGELTASIAHEVNQPLAAIVTNGNACLRWLAGDSPNLDEARETARRIIRDGNRAGDVIGRIRTLLRKTGTEKELLDMNQAIREVVALAEGEVRRNGVALRTELAGDLPPILGDRVELEQVVLNLIMNAIEAMSAIGDRPRELVIGTQSGEVDQVRVTVQDSGIGLDAQSMGRIFDAFYTTKPQGMGMGLAISRSIIEAHGGRLWAVPNDGPGATFQFTLMKYG